MILPEKQFYLFGMGDRDKLIYRDGMLISYPSYSIYKSFNVINEEIIPCEYTVRLTTDAGTVIINENESGVYMRDEGGATVAVTESKLSLPDFAGFKHRDAMRILHHEILINIIDGLPVPNFFVYKKPWYRDGAMMALVLEKTGNLRLISDWANSLNDCYDRNNAGNEEADNLGQAMYIIARAGRKDHPLIRLLIDEAKRRAPDGTLSGPTDGGEHPVYQTKWLRFGLEALGMDSSWVNIPTVGDSYSTLFWMDYRDEGGVQNDIDAPFNQYYPYLWWAKEHYYGKAVEDSLFESCYPMTWETFASEANYPLIAPISQNYADSRHCAPHTWHSAEMLLYLFDEVN